MTAVQTFAIAGPLLLTPRVFGDARGFFLESWNARVWAQLLAEHGQEPVDLVQDNHSRSSRGVLRGLHYQLPPHPQGKLVRCVVGEIFDVAVDLRRSSASFGQWVGARLSAENHQQLWVPAGFAHGFLTLSEHAEVLYKTTDFWSQPCERSIRWDDPDLAMAWPADGLPAAQPLLAEKDANAPSLAQAVSAGDVFP
ncbi:MAG: dTDP-4-dehydrorhamnose 3,5-epimerase [Cyanobacteriota bacterium]|jgi:dTDP-4-dehydrorhamnose 3,5-epimerase